METVTKYENFTGKEVKIVKASFINEEDGISYDYLRIKISDYISLDLVHPDYIDVLQIFVDYVNQFRWLTSNQLDSLCQRFTDIFCEKFSKDDILEEFGI